MKKKFKIKIKHHSRDKYTISWAEYWFIPFWIPISFWYSTDLTSTSRWTPCLFTIEKAEEVAKRLKSFDDVWNYEEPYRINQANFQKRKKEYLEKNVPYKSKII